MSDAIINPEELTAEQRDILQKDFLYEEAADLNEDDLKILAEMFDDPKKLKVLRKAFNIVTVDEKGFTRQADAATVNLNPSDPLAYIFENAVNTLSDERIRKAIVGIYQRVRSYRQREMTDKFEKGNVQAYEEKQRTEEFHEEQASGKRTLGENL